MYILSNNKLYYDGMRILKEGASLKSSPFKTLLPISPLPKKGWSDQPF